MALFDGIGKPVSAIELGEVMDVNEREVRRLVEKGILRRCSPGRYRLEESIHRYVRYRHQEIISKQLNIH